MTVGRYSMTLFPADVTLPALMDTEREDDPQARLKLHAGGWVYYVVERGVGADNDVCFGLVIGHEIELGYFTVSELVEMGARRDTQFQPERVSVLRRCHGGDDDPTLVVNNPDLPILPGGNGIGWFIFIDGEDTDWDALTSLLS